MTLYALRLFILQLFGRHVSAAILPADFPPSIPSYLDY